MNKRLIAYILILLLALVGISFFGGPVTYLFLWLALLLPVFSFLYIGYVILFLKIYQRTDGRNMVSGTPSDFYITLQNEGPFSFSALRIKYYSSFSTIMDLEEDVIYEMPPKASVKRNTLLLCRYRGEYEVGIKKITVWDFLGIFSFTYNIKEPLSVIVAPALVHLPELDSMDPFSDADHDCFVNRTEPDITVREYLAGDELRFIHWKSSAVMQKLMIRERIGEEKNGIGIFMDSRRYGKRKEDFLAIENKIIETVLALSEYYIRNHIPVDVSFQKVHTCMQTIRDERGFEALYDEMFRYIFRDDHSLLQMLAELSDRNAFDYKLLVFVVHQWGADEVSWVEQVNTSHVPVIVYMIAPETEAEEKSRDGSREFSLHHIGTEASLQEVL